jgi:DNA uptake protein ComE-like DNA-binding protein
MKARIFFHKKSERGSVLIVVLVVCLGLVSLTLVFGHSMLMAYRGADNGTAGRQAEQAIEGAARYVEYLMSNVTTPGTMPDITTYQSEQVPVGDAFFWFIGEPLPTDPVNTPAFGLVDEASKLNLNTATLEMLESLPGMTQDFAQAIITWRTAQAGTSATATIASTTEKGAPFESVEELARVSGADLTVLYGEDANLNHVLDPNEDDGEKTPPSDNADGKLDPGIFEYVTVFSREPNTLSDGTARVNVTVPSAALPTLLDSTFTSERAAEIRRNIGGGAGIRSILEFYIRSQMTEDEFGKIYPKLTMKTGTYSTGLVNVNTASQTVLACIPGIGDKAAQLVATRQNQTQVPVTPAWVVPILGPQATIQAGPFLTAQSYQISADVAAVGSNGHGYRRTLFVIDSSAGTPQIVYRRNLASLGWALGADVRQTLATRKVVQ